MRGNFVHRRIVASVPWAHAIARQTVVPPAFYRRVPLAPFSAFESQAPVIAETPCAFSRSRPEQNSPLKEPLCFWVFSSSPIQRAHRFQSKVLSDGPPRKKIRKPPVPSPRLCVLRCSRGLQNSRGLVLYEAAQPSPRRPKDVVAQTLRHINAAPAPAQRHRFLVTRFSRTLDRIPRPFLFSSTFFFLHGRGGKNPKNSTASRWPLCPHVFSTVWHSKNPSLSRLRLRRCSRFVDAFRDPFFLALRTKCYFLTFCGPPFWHVPPKLGG